MDQDENGDDDDIIDSKLSSVEFQVEGNSAGTTVVLRRGPWSEEEDAILKDYVNKHGEGNWNAVEKFSGLSRCGKSCRLRWTNHLRPDLKKGPFSPEEERLIIELYAKLGSKWSRMATQLPGRSDNDIKNFWNTRVKRLMREGLPLFPPDVRVEIQTESPQSLEPTPFTNGNISSPHSCADVRYDEIEVFKIPENLISSTFSIPAFLEGPLRNILSPVPKPDPSYSCSNMISIFPPVPYTLGAFDPPGLDPSQSFNHLYNTVGESSRIDASFPCQSNRDPPQEFSTVNGLYPSTDNPNICFSPNSHADVNGYNPPQFPQHSFGSTMMELPSIQKSVSAFSFDSANIPLPQTDPGMLQPVTTHHEIIDPAEKIADEFLNWDAELEAYTERDVLIGPSDPSTSTLTWPLPEYPTAAQISAMDTKAHEVPASGTELVSWPTVADTGNGYSYQLDTSDPAEWLNGNDYTALDETMSAFISDEDVDLTFKDL